MNLLRRLEGRNAHPRIAAVVRVALLPLLLPAEAFESSHQQPDLNFTDPLLVLIAAYAVILLIYTFSTRRELKLAPFAVADTLLIALLIYAEGGALADIRFALGMPVLVVAFLEGPRLTASIAALAVLSFVLASVLHNELGGGVSDHYIAVHALDLAWRGALAVVVSYCLTSRAERIRELLESRRQLVTQSLRAEAQARRQLSYALHDGLAQDLLCVQQDLKAASRGRTEYLGRAQLALGDAVAQLRGQIFLLHPHQLEREGLAAALETVASRQLLAGGARPLITVAPGVDGRDAELLFSVARELLINAVRHAEASEVTLTVDRVGDDIVVACRDNGCGFTPQRRRNALENGHLGLAACTERVESVDGTFEIVTAPGRGTLIRATVPAGRLPDAADAAPAAPARAPLATTTT
ncbi:MAG: two-component system, NarL family, sensor kinase [Solirubrobacteraceae bacterium]|jgi:two-component system NarL family sensor kinase|nr:two-component system, NarL family, sensor kinase [Solirubrobacteraceae bacterium]